MSRQYFTVCEVNALVPDLAAAAGGVRDAAGRLAALSKSLYRGESPPPDTQVPSDYLDRKSTRLNSSHRL